MSEVRPVAFCAPVAGIAGAPAAQLDFRVFPHAYLAPAFVIVQRVGWNLLAIAFIGADIVHVGRHDQLTRAISIQVADRGIGVEDAMSIAALVAQLRPPRTQLAIMLVDPCVYFPVNCPGGDDLQGAVFVQVGDRKAAQL